ncbi:MAG: hypothetical protein IMY72_06895 [Bacteroidetes bacterium]|nr:hypothetical protein [Bacteroidota bacterium]
MTSFLNAKKALGKKGLSYKILSHNKSSVNIVDKIDNEIPRNYNFAQNAFQMDDYWKDHTKITKQIDVPVLIITLL